MEQRDLKDYKDFLPSRAKLGRLSLWAATEAEREAASRMLDVMRKAGIVDKEPVPWEDSSWNPANMPTLAEMALSPAGRRTLELLGPTPKDSKTKSAEPEVTVAPVVPEPTAPSAEPAIPPLEPPPGPSDDLGVRLEQERAEKREREKTNPPWKWDMLKPSAPDKSLRPLAPSDWNSDASNAPIY
jgi:hypothetical protein